MSCAPVTKIFTLCIITLCFFSLQCSKQSAPNDLKLAVPGPIFVPPPPLPTPSSASWTRLIGSPGGYCVVTSMAIDYYGNIVLVGLTNNALDGNAMIGRQDIFLAKYDSNGVKQWVRQFGVVDGSFSSSLHVRVDPSQDIIVVGGVAGAFEGNVYVGDVDQFIARHNSSGERLWVHQYGVSGQVLRPNAISTDSLGNLFIAGYSSEYAGDYSKVGFISMYDLFGTVLWKNFIDMVAQSDTSLEVDNVGEIILTGSDVESYTNTGDTYTKYKMVVRKFNVRGALVWERNFGVENYDAFGHSTAVDSLGNIYVGGKFITRGGDLDRRQGYFLVKYDATGTQIWHQYISVSVGSSISESSLYNYVTVGSDGGIFALVYSYAHEIPLLIKYDANGTKQWERQIGTTQYNTVSGVNTDPSGNVYVIGGASYPINGYAPVGQLDSFIVKYDSNGS